MKTGRLLSVFIYALVICIFQSAPAFSAVAVSKPSSDFLQSEFSELSRQIRAHSALGKTMVSNDEKVLDRNSLIWDTDRDPTDVVLRRTEAMLAELLKSNKTSGVSAFSARLAELKQARTKQQDGLGKTAAITATDATYQAAQALNRDVMLANAALDFTDLIFIERGILTPGVEIDGDHMCDQYYGHNGRLGGGLFILRNFATSPVKVNLMTGLSVPSGTNKGKLMTSGTFLSPDLSFDGKTILFAWSSGGREKFVPENRFSIFSINVDGTNLKRITDGDYDDIHPCWMPSGRIVFISTRRTGYGRCHGRSVPTYTLYSMKPDGSDMFCISYHETNEWHPAVANDGRIVFSRWDYIDRDFSAGHHLWFCNPDGTNPRSWGGNYSFPLNTLGAGPFTDQRSARPWAEFNGRAIPGSTKFIATAGPHHGQALGSLILKDYNTPDDNKMAQITRITPDAPFPEGSTAWRAGYVYGTAWPLSESSYLCNYNNTIILLDKSGSKQEFYRTTSDANLRPIYPIPLCARTKPNDLAVQTYQGERWNAQVPKATLNIINVNITDDYGKLPAGVAIKSMRIIQVLPKSTPLADDPRVGYGSEDLVRMSLGTVPVESDGSVYCEAPIGKAIYFQLLDDKGMAVQSMRSVTFAHPGERLACIGCHEDKWEASPNPPSTIASLRAPSKITPEAGNVEPVNFYRLVKPVFDAKCVVCHKQQAKGPQDMSYRALEPYAFYYTGTGDNWIPYHAGSRSTPGKVGSGYARMGKALISATHQKALSDGKFTTDDMRKVTLWLDCNSVELGAYTNVDLQRAGRLIWPTLDVDPQDPQGLDYSTIGMQEKGLFVKIDNMSSSVAYSTSTIANAAYRYLRYIGSTGNFCNIAEMEFYNGNTKLAGTAFGTSPSYSAGSEFDKASDGNTSTAFDCANADNGYTGIDLGAGNAAKVSTIRYWPRSTFESRMAGGKFQGSNTSSSTGYLDLYKIASTPAGGQWSSGTVPEYVSEWTSNSGTSGYATTEHFSNTKNSTATFTFSGVGAQFFGYKRNDLGIVQISVDGVVKTTIDCYSADPVYDTRLYEISGLTSGSHTLTVTITGNKNAASSGTGAIIDAFAYYKNDPSVPVQQALVVKERSIAIRILGQQLFLPAEFAGKPLTIKLLDLNGRLIQTMGTNNHGTVVQKSIGSIGRGIYIVKCESVNKTVSRKIINLKAGL